MVYLSVHDNALYIVPPIQPITTFDHFVHHHRRIIRRRDGKRDVSLAKFVDYPLNCRARSTRDVKYYILSFWDNGKEANRVDCVNGKRKCRSFETLDIANDCIYRRECCHLNVRSCGTGRQTRLPGCRNDYERPTGPSVGSGLCQRGFDCF